MDPVSQVLAQQQSGSAEGQGFGQFYAEGKRLAQQQQNLNLSSQRLRLEQQQETRLQKESDMLTPIRAELSKNQAINFGIEADLNRQKVNQITELNSALPEIYQLQTAFARSPDGFADTNLISKAESLANRFPKAFAPGMPGGELLLNMQSVPMRRQMFNQIKDMNKQLEGTGLKLQQLNPKTGNMEFMRDQTGSDTTSAIKNANMVSTLQDLITNEQDPAVKRSLQTRLNALQAQIEKPGMVIRTNPDGTVEYIQGPASQINKGTQSKLEETTSSTVTLLEAGKDLISLAQDPNNVGIRGNLIRKFNQIAPNFGVPPVEGGKQFEFKANATYYGQNVIKQLKSDGQIAQREVSKLEGAVSDGGWLESQKSVTDLTTRMNELLSLSQVLRLARNGQPIPQDLLTRLPEDTALKAVKEGIVDSEAIRTLFRAGKISEDDAVKAIAAKENINANPAKR